MLESGKQKQQKDQFIKAIKACQISRTNSEADFDETKSDTKSTLQQQINTVSQNKQDKSNSIISMNEDSQKSTRKIQIRKTFMNIINIPKQGTQLLKPKWRKGRSQKSQATASQIDEFDVFNGLQQFNNISHRSFDEFSDIQIMELLGKGAFGKVYKGMRQQGEILAVKVIEHQVPYNTNPTQQEILNRTFSCNEHGIITLPLEVIVNQQIRHPNIVRTYKYQSKPVYDPREKQKLRKQQEKSTVQQLFSRNSQKAGYYDQTGSQDLSQYVGKIIETWLVLEYCDMGTLYEYIIQKKLQNLKYQTKLEFIWLTAMDVAQAMQYLHSNQIVHGDLKSQNVLLSSCSQDRRGFMVKVGDFGLSRILFKNYSHVNTKTHGTISYMPPEMLHKGRLAPAVDVYSYGILLWELFTGAVAFSGMNHFQVLVGIVQQGIIPNMYHQNLPNFIKPLLLDCWARDPTQRPSFQSIIQRLNQNLQSIMVTGDAILMSPQFSVNDENLSNDNIQAASKENQEHSKTQNLKQNMFRYNSGWLDHQKSPRGGSHLPYIDTAKISDTSQKQPQQQRPQSNNHGSSTNSPTNQYKVTQNSPVPEINQDHQPQKQQVLIRNEKTYDSNTQQQQLILSHKLQPPLSKEQQSDYDSDVDQSSNTSKILSDSMGKSSRNQKNEINIDYINGLDNNQQIKDMEGSQYDLTYNNPYYLTTNSNNKRQVDSNDKLVNKTPDNNQQVQQNYIKHQETYYTPRNSDKVYSQYSSPLQSPMYTSPQNVKVQSPRQWNQQSQLLKQSQIQQQQDILQKQQGIEQCIQKEQFGQTTMQRYLNDQGDIQKNENGLDRQTNFHNTHQNQQNNTNTEHVQPCKIRILQPEITNKSDTNQDTNRQSNYLSNISHDQQLISDESFTQNQIIPRSPKPPFHRITNPLTIQNSRNPNSGVEMLNTISAQTNASSFKENLNNILSTTVTNNAILTQNGYDQNINQDNLYLEHVKKNQNIQSISPYTGYPSKMSTEGGVASYQMSVNNINYSIYENLTDNECASQGPYPQSRIPQYVDIEASSYKQMTPRIPQTPKDQHGYSSPYFNLTKNTLRQQQQQQQNQLSPKMSAQQSSRSYSTYQEAIQDYNGSDGFVGSSQVLGFSSNPVSLNKENLKQLHSKEHQQEILKGQIQNNSYNPNQSNVQIHRRSISNHELSTPRTPRTPPSGPFKSSSQQGGYKQENKNGYITHTQTVQLLKQQQKGGFDFDKLLGRPKKYREFSYTNFIHAMKHEQTYDALMLQDTEKFTSIPQISPIKDLNKQNQFRTYNTNSSYITSKSGPAQQQDVGFNKLYDKNQKDYTYNSSLKLISQPITSQNLDDLQLSLSRLRSLQDDKKRVQTLQFQKEFELHKEKQIMLRHNMKETVKQAKEKYMMMQEQIENDMRQYYLQIEQLQQEIEKQEHQYKQQMLESQPSQGQLYKFKYLKSHNIDTQSNGYEIKDYNYENRNVMKDSQEWRFRQPQSVQQRQNVLPPQTQSVEATLPSVKGQTVSQSVLTQEEQIEQLKRHKLDSQGIDNLTLQRMVNGPSIGRENSTHSQSSIFESRKLHNARNALHEIDNKDTNKDKLYSIERPPIINTKRAPNQGKRYNMEGIQQGYKSDSDNSSIYKTIPNSNNQMSNGRPNGLQRTSNKSVQQKIKSYNKSKDLNTTGSEGNLVTYQSLRFNTNREPGKIATQESINYGQSNLFGKQRIENSNLLGKQNLNHFQKRPLDKSGRSRLQSKLMNSITLDKYLHDEHNNLEHLLNPQTNDTQTIEEENSKDSQVPQVNTHRLNDTQEKIKDLESFPDESLQRNANTIPGKYDLQVDPQSQQESNKLFEQQNQNQQQKAPLSQVQEAQKVAQNKLIQAQQENSINKMARQILDRDIDDSKLYQLQQKQHVKNHSNKGYKSDEQIQKPSSATNVIYQRNLHNLPYFNYNVNQQSNVNVGIPLPRSHQSGRDSIQQQSPQIISANEKLEQASGRKSPHILQSSNGHNTNYLSPRAPLSPKTPATYSSQRSNHTQDSSILQFEQDLSRLMQSELSNYSQDKDRSIHA